MRRLEGVTAYKTNLPQSTMCRICEQQEARYVRIIAYIAIVAFVSWVSFLAYLTGKLILKFLKIIV